MLGLDIKCKYFKKNDATFFILRLNFEKFMHSRIVALVCKVESCLSIKLFLVFSFGQFAHLKVSELITSLPITSPPITSQFEFNV